MSQDKTGGAAFPNYVTDLTGTGLPTLFLNDKGITALDYFAAKAMQAICNTGDWNDVTGNEAKIADMSYKMAAAMLEARKQYIK